MLGNEKILAIVPAYNPDQQELTASLNSLLRQTYKIDILIIDDGSMKPVSLQGQLNPTINILRLENNAGITKALITGVNWGLANNYDYFCRLDSGDIAYPNRVERQLEYMRAHQEIDLLGCRARVFDLEGNYLFNHGIAGGSKEIKRYLFKNSPFKHSTFFVRSSAFRLFGNYDTVFDSVEDYELIFRFSKLGMVACMPDVLIDYVDNPSGISRSKRTKQLQTRLRCQLKYGDSLEASFYGGVLRTLGLLVMPNLFARWLSKWHWNKFGALGKSQ